MIVISNLEKDFKDIFDIINDASGAYKGIIPEDRWQEPYMPEEELKKTNIRGGRVLEF